MVKRWGSMMLVGGVVVMLLTGVGWATTKNGSAFTGSLTLSPVSVSLNTGPPITYTITVKAGSGNGDVYIVNATTDILNLAEGEAAGHIKGLDACVAQNDLDNVVTLLNGKISNVSTAPPKKK